VVVTQLREVAAAERSEEPAEEHHYHRAVRQRIGEVELLAVLVGQREVGRPVTDARRPAVHAHNPSLGEGTRIQGGLREGSLDEDDCV